MSGRKRSLRAAGNSSNKKRGTDPANSEDGAATSTDDTDNVSYLEMLPDSVMSEILKHIPFYLVVELRQMSRTLCSQIARLVDGFKTWAVHTNKNIPNFVTSTDKNVSISLHDEVSNVVLIKLCQQFVERITSIQMKYKSLQHNPKQVETKLMRLEILSIEYLRVFNKHDCIISWLPGVIANSYASLQCLHLECVNLEFFTEKTAFSALKEIIIVNCEKIPDNFFKISAPNLESLSMTEVVLPQNIEEISAAFIGLKKLLLNDIDPDGDTDTIIRTCAPSLKYLDVTALGTFFLKNLPIEFPALESIQSQPVTEDYDEFNGPSGIEYLLNKCAQSLKTLALSYDQTGINFRRISCVEFPALEKIELTDNEEMKNLPDFLAKCSNLVSFESTGSSERKRPEIYLPQTLKRHPKLKTKKLVHHTETGVWYKMSKELGASVSSKEMNISRIDVSGEDIKFLLDPRCDVRNVKYLTIRHYGTWPKDEHKQLHDQIIHFLDKFRPTLLHLHLESCSEFLDLGQLQAFPKLQEVRMKGCKILNDVLDGACNMFPVTSQLSIVNRKFNDQDCYSSMDELSPPLVKPYETFLCTVMKIDDL